MKRECKRGRRRRRKGAKRVSVRKDVKRKGVNEGGERGR